MSKPLFGPAGNGEDFAAAGGKSTLQVPAYLASLALTAYEYQCGHGVRVSMAQAERLRAAFAAYDIAVSLHAPYYISLASAEADKRAGSVRYILESARAVAAMGGRRIVVHPGGLGGLSRAGAAELALQTLREAQRALDAAGLSDVILCPEVMGKRGQLGDLPEVLGFCEGDERWLPCVDFGHLNSRTGGSLTDEGAYAAALDAIAARLGEARAARMHIHFSKIEYAAGGEKRHLTFADTVYGPEPAPLMRQLARRGWTPVVICESRGTQSVDAAALLRLYEAEKAQ